MTQEEFVVLCAEGSYECVADALASGIDPNIPAMINGLETHAIFIAASSGSYSAVRALAEAGADLTEGLIAATVGGKFSIIHFLVDLGADINARDASGTTPLLTAVTMNRPDLVEYLIEMGADVNVKSAGGYNALTYTAMIMAQPQKGTVPDEADEACGKIIELLVKNGADFWDAMMIAIKTGCGSFASMAAASGIDVNAVDGSGRGLVMYSVMTGGGALRAMLDGGADPDIPDSSGRTPLMIAAIDDEGDPEILDTLLTFGADINARDNRGLTPLMWAVVSADKTPDAVMPALIRTGGLRAEGWQMWCAFIALHAAAKRELQLDTVRRLISEGADVNAIDKRGMNAMMYALMNGDDETADILAKAGAAINFDMN